MLSFAKNLLRERGLSWLVCFLRERGLQRKADDLGNIDPDKFIVLPKEGMLFGSAEHFLLVPKNRYQMVLLPGKEATAQMGVGWLTEENTPEAYDRLWGDDKVMEDFLAEGHSVREGMPAEIIDATGDTVITARSVIDIGCGIGDLLMEAQSRNSSADFFGCDFSTAAVKGASENLPMADIKQYVIERSLPYENDRFDLVLCTDVLEHLLYPDAIVEELVRICAPGGKVVIVVPDGDVDQFFGHVWFWNMERLEKFLSKWDADVRRLDVCREFAAIIHPPKI